MMKKLYRHIIKSFLGTFLFTFFIVLFIFVMQWVWLYIDDLVGKGLELNVLGELFFYMSVTFIPMALPLALLLASIMCFGNLGEHYELVAMKASGISMWRVMRLRKPLIPNRLLNSCSRTGTTFAGFAPDFRIRTKKARIEKRQMPPVIAKKITVIHLQTSAFRRKNGWTESAS